jgi:hypothetical protein
MPTYVSKILKVYQLGNLVVFEDFDIGFLASVPKGEVRALPFRTPNEGLQIRFINNSEVVASIADFTQVQDQGGAPLGATFFDVLQVLNVLFDCPCATGGGGGVVEPNIRTESSNYLATTIDFAIVAAANITITLPATPATGQVFEVYANNNNVTVEANAGQTIIGTTNASLAGYSAIVIKYVFANTWLII